MNITSIGSIEDFTKNGLQSVKGVTPNNNATFESLFQAAVNMVQETNAYTNAAEEAEMANAMGLLDNPVDLQVAQYKANLSLQYTVAVRNAVLDAYKEIMNMQF